MQKEVQSVIIMDTKWRKIIPIVAVFSTLLSSAQCFLHPLSPVSPRLPSNSPPLLFKRFSTVVGLQLKLTFLFFLLLHFSEYIYINVWDRYICLFGSGKDGEKNFFFLLFPFVYSFSVFALSYSGISQCNSLHSVSDSDWNLCFFFHWSYFSLFF